VNRPRSIAHALEQVFISAIVARGEQKVRVWLGLLETRESFAVISPYGLHFYSVCSA
jgi:hypothetical protein